MKEKTSTSKSLRKNKDEIKKEKPKLAQFFIFKLLFALKLNFNGGQFWNIKFSYFNNLKIILKRVKKLQKLQ